MSRLILLVFTFLSALPAFANDEIYRRVITKIALPEGGEAQIVALHPKSQPVVSKNLPIVLVTPDKRETPLAIADFVIETKTLVRKNGQIVVSLFTDRYKHPTLPDQDQFVIADVRTGVILDRKTLPDGGSVHLQETKAGKLRAVIAGAEVIALWQPELGKVTTLIERERPSQYPELVNLEDGSAVLKIEDKADPQVRASVLLSMENLIERGTLTDRFKLAADETLVDVEGKKVVWKSVQHPKPDLFRQTPATITLKELISGKDLGSIRLNFTPWSHGAKWRTVRNGHLVASVSAFLCPGLYVSHTITADVDFTAGLVLHNEIVPPSHWPDRDVPGCPKVMP